MSCNLSPGSRGWTKRLLPPQISAEVSSHPGQEKQINAHACAQHMPILQLPVAQQSLICVRKRVWRQLGRASQGLSRSISVRVSSCPQLAEKSQKALFLP